jgi:anti-sigma-K factor RskA
MAIDVHALSGAYVLDAVNDIERAAFTRHLAGCESCANEVAELREVVAKLAELTEVPPPEGLRDRVLAEVSRTRQLPPEEPEPRRVTSTITTGERRWRRIAVAAVAAAVVAIAGTWVVMDSRLRDERAQVGALRSERERIYAVMNAKDVLMRGTDLPGGGRIAAAVSNSEHAGVAMLAGLPVPPRGEVYQMWLIDGGNASSAVVLPVGVIGGTMLFEWEPGADAFGITIEPAGGSKSPTMAPLGTIALS